jgi:hypothetical protein
VSTIAEFLALVDRHELSDLQAAALVGVAPATVRVIRLTGALPKGGRSRGALAAFCEANRGATCRAELRMTAQGLRMVAPSPTDVDTGRSSLADHGAGR